MQHLRTHAPLTPAQCSPSGRWLSHARTRVALIGCLAAALLAGCGGSDELAQPKAVQITSANALAVARATDDFFDLFELTEFADEFIEGRSLAWLAPGTVRQCVAGDAASGTWQVTAPGVGAVPLAGDKLSVEYKNCLQDPVLADRLTGTMTIAVKTVVGNPAAPTVKTAWSYTADLGFVKFEVKNSHRHHIIDGTLAVEVGARGLASTLHHDINDLKIASAKIHVQKDADTHEFTDVSLAIVQDFTGVAPSFQARVSGSVDSSVLGGKIDVQTVDTLTGSGATEYPNAGYAKIVGGSGTTLDFRPGLKEVVLLQVNTPGQAAQTITSSWSEIDHD